MNSNLSNILRDLRENHQLALREVAANVEMDSTLLSRIERGDRLPTISQTKALAKFYGADVRELEAARIAEKFIREYGQNPALEDALELIHETATVYKTNKSRNNLMSPGTKA